MSDNNKTRQTTTHSGVGFFGLLTILFIGLKLTGYITWSWFWVLSPIIFSFLFLVFFILVALLIISKAN